MRKFRAYISELKIWVDELAVYTDGSIGFSYEHLEKNLPKDHQIMDDGVYYSTDADFDLILSIEQGDEWIWILNENDFILMQSTGLKDKNGKEIFEGDIIEIKHPHKNRYYKGEIIFSKGAFIAKDFNFSHHDNPCDFRESIEYTAIIGNVHNGVDIG